MTDDMSQEGINRIASFAPDFEAVRHLTIEDCVRRTTAFDGTADMMSTEPTYCVKFCLSLADSPAQVAMMIRVAQAFNSYADHDGQERRALFF